MPDPFVVVGGDAAGLSAASKLKREAPDSEVVVFEKGRWVSYAHCGMPYFVKGEVGSLTDLLSLSPAEIDERGIDLRRGHEVVDVSPDERTVTVERDGETIAQPYGDLLIATGARALTAPIEGADLTGVHTMHGLDSAAGVRAHLLGPDEDALADVGGEEFVDRERVRRYGELPRPETVAIVGGGYVGVEMAEAFGAHGLDVHLFQRGPHVLPPFGEAVAERVEGTLRKEGVTLHLNTEVASLDGDGRVRRVVCRGGTELDVDAAVVGVGIRPNTDFLSDEFDRHDSGALETDACGRTSVDGVYAAGDCATMVHAVTGESAWVPLGLTANRAGRAIGQTVAGDPTPVGDVAGTAVVKAFEMECGRSGVVDHDEAREAGFDPVSETITTRSRSGYYPGAAETTVTLTADRDSERLLGGTIAGPDRAAVRIDTIATALEADLTVPELERLDLAYAPPFSPVWDPILTAAKVLNGNL